MPAERKLKAHLYIRIDEPLRLALLSAAGAEGVSVSHIARHNLRRSLSVPDETACRLGRS